MKKLVVLVLFTFSLFAMDKIVSTEWLNKNLGDKSLRVIHVSDADIYKKGHVNGSLNTSIENWRVAKGKFLVVKSNKEIQDEIQRLGIDEKSKVVLYAPIASPKDLLKATYIYWALNYHGITNVALLDGGLNKWKKDSLKLTKKTSSVKKSNYEVKINDAILADKVYVLKNLQKLPMIDARPADKYLGITPTDTVARDGHIEGAMSYSWNYSVNSEYLLKDIEKLDELFRDGYKLNKDSEVLVYCTGGLETSFNYFVLSGVLGYKHVRLYDASMKEWGNSNDTPMVRYTYEMFLK